MYYSQYNQDKWLNENIFKNKKDGVFVDVGAHNGITINNTYFFEKELNWTGICIEPIETIYNKLTSNRKAESILGCAYNRDGTVSFNQLDGYTQMLSGISNSYNERHNNRINNEIEAYGGSRKTIEVKCFTLATILSERNITHVDYLSIDTEGSEFEILEGIDFDKVTIDIIDLELNYPDEDYEKFHNFLTSKGYKFVIHIGGDIIYQKC